jgi:UDP-glucose 4-epimerase
MGEANVKTLITGAAGFLGRRFARFHNERGDTVHGLDDLSSQYAKWETGDNINNISGDAGRFFDGWNEGIVSDYDLVYHFAAPVGGREKIEGDPLFNADSLRLDSALFRWAAKFAERATIIYPSSSAVYPVLLQDRTGEPLSERQFHPERLEWGAPDQMYGFTKMAGEVLAWHAEKYGVNTLCIRPFSGYGEEQSLDYPVPSICQRVAKHQNPLTVWGSGQQARDFIHVADVVGATHARVEAGIDGYQSMNIGTGTPLEFNRLASMAARIEGYDASIENIEDKPQGVTRRFCDPTEMLKYYTPQVDLSNGLAMVIEAQR